MFNTPILFIIFKRKSTALQAFDPIKKLKPSTLYIAGDGARTHIDDEVQMVEDTRQAILNAIDWDCDVHTLFRKENLGCGRGVSKAIDWLFENEETGIIIEDDCVSDNSFFLFADEMLSRYNSDERVGMIAGTNQVGNYRMPYSYCFSKYTACWGWATWRRAWRNMDADLNVLKSHKKDLIENRGYLGKEKARWNYQIRMLDLIKDSVWDWQWYFSLASQNQLCIFPKVNLISNVGNDTAATHTSFSDITFNKQSLTFPLEHPIYIMPDSQFDRKFYHSANTLKRRILRNIPYSLKEKVRTIIAKFKK